MASFYFIDLGQTLQYDYLPSLKQTDRRNFIFSLITPIDILMRGMRNENRPIGFFPGFAQLRDRLC